MIVQHGPTLLLLASLSCNSSEKFYGSDCETTKWITLVILYYHQTPAYMLLYLYKNYSCLMIESSSFTFSSSEEDLLMILTLADKFQLNPQLRMRGHLHPPSLLPMERGGGRIKQRRPRLPKRSEERSSLTLRLPLVTVTPPSR